jgi:branched-chain amino acid transport system ATP-binding protein
MTDAGAGVTTHARSDKVVTDAASALLDIRQLEVTYNRVAIAIQGISMMVGPGAIVVLLGRNGAGKTTTLRAVSGFLPIDAAKITDGEIHFAGKRIDGRQPHQIAHLVAALIPEREKVFRTLTVEQNLRMVPMPRPKERQDLYTFIRDIFPGLSNRWRNTAGYLSGGEIQMLAVSKALLLQPRLLLPDEVSLGIAPALVEKMMEALKRINRESGMAIMMAEQNAAVALEIADYAYVMEAGAIQFEGSPAQLAGDQTLKELYLGLSQTGTYAEAGRRRARQ